MFTSFQSFVCSFVSFPTRPNIKQKYLSLTELLCLYLLPGWSLPLAPCWWRLLKASRSWQRPETSRPSAGTSCDWSPKTERCVKLHKLQDNTGQPALLTLITWVYSLGIISLYWTPRHLQKLVWWITKLSVTQFGVIILQLSFSKLSFFFFFNCSSPVLLTGLHVVTHTEWMS